MSQIPEQAIEAAAQALFSKIGGYLTWEEAAEPTRDWARAALTAAWPLLRGEWRDLNQPLPFGERVIWGLRLKDGWLCEIALATARPALATHWLPLTVLPAPPVQEEQP